MSFQLTTNIIFISVMQCRIEITIYGDNKNKLEKTETKIKFQINSEQEKDIHLVTR